MAQSMGRMARRNTSVDISTTVENRQQRSFANVLLIGTGNYFSRNTWQHICMQLQDRLKAYHIAARYQYLSRDSMEAKRQYAQLMQENKFDAVVWFACDGQAHLSELLHQPSYMDAYGNAWGGGTIKRPATDQDSSLALNGERGDNLLNEQRWMLTVYTPGPDAAVVWAADMTTRVMELNEKSYRKVTDALLAQMEKNQILPVTEAKK
ncbi:hypothetical protein DCC81_06000 [Chitinophaga parva]|uniref:Uncharacterized protein n=2 Tax=Chitinophaga parva TaxID=2169414 RepID=A0A2T7BN25_9BACT|nr:hypothetical protein DCC81_06000 [Chitinophaga parva]